MLEDLITRLKKYPRDEVSYKSGVSRGTLDRLLSGENTNPTIKTVGKLNDYLEKKENELSSKGEQA